MIFQLPLIFSDGRPSSIQDLTQEDLIEYVTLLQNYNIEHEDGAFSYESTGTILRPPIWRKLPCLQNREFKFCTGVNVAPTNSQWSKKILVDLITTAYQYHNAGVLIGLSALLGRSDGIAGDFILRERETGYTEVVRSNGELVLICRTAPKLDSNATTDETSTSTKECTLNTQTDGEQLSLLKLGFGFELEKYARSDAFHKQEPESSKSSNASKKRRLAGLGNVSGNGNSSQKCLQSSQNKSKDWDPWQPRVLLKRLDVCHSGTQSNTVNSSLKNSARPIPLLDRRRNSKESDHSSSADSGCHECSTSSSYSEPEECNNEKIQQHPLDEESAKASFLAGLGLVCAANVHNSTTSGPFSRWNVPKRKLSTHLQKRNKQISGGYVPPRRSNRVAFSMLNFIKRHPLPLTDGLGRQLAVQHSNLSLQKRKSTVLEYEKYCKDKKNPTRKKVASVKPKVKYCKIKRRNNRKKVSKVPTTNNDGHKFCFTTKERLDRNSEIVVGMAKNSFQAFNQCRTFSVELNRTSDAEIAKEMSSKIQKTVKLSFLENPQLYLPVVILDECDKNCIR